MADMPASAPAQAEVTLSGFPFDIPGTWARKSGGRTAGEARKWHEGGELRRERVAGGQSSTENVTLSRNYIPSRDQAVLAQARRYANRAFGNMSQQDLDVNEIPYGKAEVFRVLLLGVSGPDVDADNTGGFQTIEIEVAIDGEAA